MIAIDLAACYGYACALRKYRATVRYESNKMDF